MKKELSFKGFILTFSLFLILLFQNVLEQYINILKYFDDMKIEDISYVLDVPINTVKSHLKRAKESLSDILKEGI